MIDKRSSFSPRSDKTWHKAWIYQEPFWWWR